MVTIIVSISLLIFGAYYYFDPLGARTSTQSKAQTSQEQVFINQTGSLPVESRFAQFLYGPTLTPTPSGMPTTTPLPTPLSYPTLHSELSNDKRTIFLTFANLSGVSRISYSVSYLAKTGNKGVRGTIEVAQPSAPIKRDITLGTCSKNVCTYDEITTPINVLAIFRMIDGMDVELMETVPY